MKKQNLLQEVHKVLGLFGLTEKLSQEDLKKRIEELSSRKFEKLSFDDVRYAFYEILNQEKIIVSFDWKWQPEDLFFILKSILPKFSYKIGKQESNEEKMEFSVDFILDDQKLNTTNPFDGGPTQLVEEYLNPYISKKFNKKLVEYDTEGDSYGFVLVPLRSYSHIIKSRFFPRPRKSGFIDKLFGKLFKKNPKVIKAEEGEWKKEKDIGFTSILIPVTEKRRIIINNHGKKQDSVRNKRIYYFKPRGVSLSKYSPEEIYLELKEAYESAGKSLLTEVKPRKGNPLEIDKFRELGRGEFNELVEIAEKLDFEKWGELRYSLESWQLLDKDQGNIIYAFVHIFDSEQLGKLIRVSTYNKKHLDKVLMLLSVNEDEIINKNYPMLLAEKMELV